jgi:hypothetical protein
MTILLVLPLVLLVISQILAGRNQARLTAVLRRSQGSITVRHDNLVVVSGQNIYRLPCLVYYW